MRNAFDHLTSALDVRIRELNCRISEAEYAEFDRMWVIYALQEKRYGQAFCEHFNLPKITPLYWFKSFETCDRWIKENYLK